MMMPSDFALENWIRRVSALPYLERRQEIARQIKWPQARFLYKYRAIDPNSKESIQWTRDILVNSRLWLSTPLDFNDPFDTSFQVIVKGTSKQIRARIEDIARRKGMNRKEGKSHARDFAKLPMMRQKEILDSGREESVRKLGVYCFAGDPRSILMWSHYASEHKGICIQFERANDYATLINAIAVDYCNKLPTANWITDFTEDLKNAILSKFEEWKYEREERIVKPDCARTYLPLKPEAITAIIFGCRVTDGVRDVVEKLLVERRKRGAPDIAKYCAYKAPTTYSLCLRREIDR